MINMGLGFMLMEVRHKNGAKVMADLRGSSELQ